RVNQGRLELDHLLPRVTSDAYSTTPLAGPTEVAKTAPSDQTGAKTNEANLNALPAPPPQAAAAEPPSAGIFDDATMNVTIDLPSNMVLRGRDLRAASGSMGIGDMNVTLGGRVTVQKGAGESTGLLGNIEVVRGYYQFQGRRFEIVRGSEIRFQGSRPIN